MLEIDSVAHWPHKEEINIGGLLWQIYLFLGIIMYYQSINNCSFISLHQAEMSGSLKASMCMCTYREFSVEQTR